MKIYLTGGWGYGNVGDEAILKATLHSISDEFPGSEIFLTSFDPENTFFHHGVRAIPSIHRICYKKSIIGPFKRRLIEKWLSDDQDHISGLLAATEWQQHVDAIKGADVVVMGGGGYFNDLWREAFPSRLIELELFRRYKKKVHIYGQTIGPFNTDFSERNFAPILRAISHISYRDEQSVSTLKKYQFPPERASLTADEANLLAVDVLSADALKGYGLRTEGPLVGLMAQYFRPYESVTGTQPLGRIKNHKSYLREWINVIESLRRDVGVNFVFLPSTNNSRRVAKQINKILQNRHTEKIEVLQDIPINDYVKLCQSVDLMITTNMHPAILATTAAVPTIALSYYYKVDDFMDASGQGDHLWRIDDFSAVELAMRAIELLNQGREPLESVRVAHDALKSRARSNAQDLRALITV